MAPSLPRTGPVVRGNKSKRREATVHRAPTWSVVLLALGWSHYTAGLYSSQPLFEISEIISVLHIRKLSMSLGTLWAASHAKPNPTWRKS